MLVIGSRVVVHGRHGRITGTAKRAFWVTFDAGDYGCYAYWVVKPEGV